MNSKQQKTLQAIFKIPPKKDLDWSDIESLLVAIGAKLTEGNGSRIKFEYKGRVVAFHRPHKPKTAKIYQINIAKEFLQDAGVTP